VLGPSRRGALTGGLAGGLAGAFALSACGRGGRGEADARTYPPRRGPPPGLRDLATFPVGTCLSTAELADPAYVALAVRHCSLVIPSWQLQMEAVLQADGRFDFSAADQISASARANGQALHATTLLWYAQEPAALKALDGTGEPFAQGVRNYIAAAVGRYRGQAVSWDAVNEPVEWKGGRLRDTLWGRNLGGESYIDRAFEWAHEADPDAILVLNDYDLERFPSKRRTFLQLAERLLKRGAPLGALGTQCHLDVGVDPALVRPAMRDLASLGLPIRVSELDCSTTDGGEGLSPAQALDRQARLFGETAEAFLELPAHQRLAFCVWGLDDRRSWLRYRNGGGDRDDRPLPFDDADRPKPAFWALADTFGRSA
jgi:endo-1,4-beta-xylanase